MPAPLPVRPDPALVVSSDMLAPEARFAGIQTHSTARGNEAPSPLNMFEISLPPRFAPATSAPGAANNFVRSNLPRHAARHHGHRRQVRQRGVAAVQKSGLV
jgi:hypothetical protein